MHFIFPILYTIRMAVAYEAVETARHRGHHPDWHVDRHSPHSLRVPLLTSLANHPDRFPARALPRRLDVFGLQPHVMHILTEAGMVNPESEVDEGTVFQESISGHNPTVAHQVEVGQVFAYAADDTRRDITEAPIVRGTHTELRALNEQLHDLARADMVPVLVVHNHPDDTLPFPTFGDYLPVIQQAPGRKGRRLLSGTSVVTPRVQIVARTTAETPSPMVGARYDEFYERWTTRFSDAGRFRDGDGFTQVEQEAAVQRRRDQVAVRLAEELKLQFYIGTNMQHLYAQPPRLIMAALRSIPQYRSVFQ